MRTVGLALLVLVWVTLVAAFLIAGDGSIRYWLFVTAHVLNAVGFLLLVLVDKMDKLGFSSVRFVYALAVEVLLFIIGPIMMSAAVAAAAR